MSASNFRRVRAIALAMFVAIAVFSPPKVCAASTAPPPLVPAGAATQERQPVAVATGVANATSGPQATFPAGFVVVQSSYLEQVSALAKIAIESAKEREESTVRIVQVIGLMLGFITAAATFLGYQTYKDVKEQVAAISKTGEEVGRSSEKIKAVVKKATERAGEFEKKLLGLERLFIGIHSVRLVIRELAPGRSQQQINDALGELDEARNLYQLSKEHDNKRIQSFMAANLSIVCMRAQRWNDAQTYGEESITCNPKTWSDRQYNLACIFARKYEALGATTDKNEALRLMTKYFERHHPSPVSLAEVDEALTDDDLSSIKEELAEMRRTYEPQQQR